MYTIVDLCLLCLKTDKNLKKILSRDSDGVLVEEKIRFVMFEFVKIKTTMSKHSSICLHCLENLNYVYNFKQLCLRNIIKLSTYIQILNTTEEPCRYNLQVTLIDLKTVNENLIKNNGRSEPVKTENLDNNLDTDCNEYISGNTTEEENNIEDATIINGELKYEIVVEKEDLKDIDDDINTDESDIKSELDNISKVIPSSSKNTGTKNFFCIYCKKLVTRFARHIISSHKNKKRVLQIMSYPVKHKQRKNLINKLRNEGTLLYNSETKFNTGQLIVTRRPNIKKRRTENDYVPCPNCFGYYISKSLYKHKKYCLSNQKKTAKNNIKTDLKTVNESPVKNNSRSEPIETKNLKSDNVSSKTNCSEEYISNTVQEENNVEGIEASIINGELEYEIVDEIIKEEPEDIYDEIDTSEIDIKFELDDVSTEKMQNQSTNSAENLLTLNTSLRGTEETAKCNEVCDKKLKQSIHKCDVCCKTFNRTYHLLMHERTHTGEAPHKCDDCGKAFKKISNLRRHKLIHTGVKSYKCDTCGKAFRYSSNLKSHKITHTDEKPYKCNVCGKAFIRPDHLQLHILKHTGEKPYKCNVCSKAFFRTDQLQSHMWIHTGDKPYKCDSCGKAFRRSYNLKRHKLAHSGENPYKCNVCGKALSNASNLLRHKRIHTGEYLFKCDTCGKSLSTKNNLIKHKRTHTKGKTIQM